MKFNIKLNTIKDVEDFTDYANNVNGEIYLRQGRYVVSGKSVMGILSLSLLDELELSIDEPKDDFYDFFEKIKDMGIIVTDWGGVVFIRDTRKQNCLIDIDGVIFDTVATINRLYHEDFKYYDNYEEVDPDDINTWEFAELKLASREYINNYFNQQRFFDNLILFDGVRYSISALSDKYKIIFVSMGDSPNLKLKNKWVNDNLPWCEFIGVDFKDHFDKSHINMEDAVFVDDSSKNLFTSNAARKICFGDVKSWNQDWNGERVSNWKLCRKKLLAEV